MKRQMEQFVRSRKRRTPNKREKRKSAEEKEEQ